MTDLEKDDFRSELVLTQLDRSKLDLQLGNSGKFQKWTEIFQMALRASIDWWRMSVTSLSWSSPLFNHILTVVTNIKFSATSLWSIQDVSRRFLDKLFQKFEIKKCESLKIQNFDLKYEENSNDENSIFNSWINKSVKIPPKKRLYQTKEISKLWYFSFTHYWKDQIEEIEKTAKIANRVNHEKSPNKTKILK